MTVVLKLTEGREVRLDRSLRLQEVMLRINDARGGERLLDFANDRTPSTVVWVDPKHVVTASDDGYHS